MKDDNKPLSVQEIKEVIGGAIAVACLLAFELYGMVR